jgi:hypothetical protein
MKQFFLGFLTFLITVLVKAQEPVRWEYSFEKVSNDRYELHFKASVLSPWHIYSQFTPEGGPFPTKFNFTKKQSITFEGNVKEIGEKIKRYESVFGIEVEYYEEKVDFIQNVKLKKNIKTNFSCTVRYMVCSETQCSLPKTILFSVPLN